MFKQGLWVFRHTGLLKEKRTKKRLIIRFFKNKYV